METTTVRIVIYENEKQVDELAVKYYHGQTYSVRLVTPDGLDAESNRTTAQEA